MGKTVYWETIMLRQTVTLATAILFRSLYLDLYIFHLFKHKCNIELAKNKQLIDQPHVFFILFNLFSSLSWFQFIFLSLGIFRPFFNVICLSRKSHVLEETGTLAAFTIIISSSSFNSLLLIFSCYPVKLFSST